MPKNRTSITGRDGYIINKALLYAIAHIQNLPEDRQEWSDMRDMCSLVKASMSPFTLGACLSVQHHTGIAPNLWPESDEELTPEDKEDRDEFATRLQNLVTSLAEALRLSNDGTLAAMSENAIHQFTVDTPHGPVTAMWHRSGANILVRYGERERLAEASEDDAANEFVARHTVRGWIRDDLVEKEAA